MGSPSLEVLQGCGIWGHGLGDGLGSDGLVVGLDNLKGLFQSKLLNYYMN